MQAKAPKISDEEWFELQFHPDLALQKYGIVLPEFPSDKVQMVFTGMSGRPNLQVAFDFYRYVLSICRLNDLTNPRILDFGGGWGRIARFFLRETTPERIYVSDAMDSAIKCLRVTGAQFTAIHNHPLPPIREISKQFDLIYAFSVFSHLSESYFLAWADYLLSLLRPQGHLVFTTLGGAFIDYLDYLHRHGSEQSYEHNNALKAMAAPEVIRRRYTKGEYQFYPTGGGPELSADCYGQTLIPRSFIERRFGSALIDFRDDLSSLNQNVAVLRRTDQLTAAGQTFSRIAHP